MQLILFKISNILNVFSDVLKFCITAPSSLARGPTRSNDPKALRVPRRGASDMQISSDRSRSVAMNDYQKRTYNALTNSTVNTIITMTEGSTLNIFVSRTNAFGLIFGPAKLVATMAITVKKNDSPIQI